MFFSKYEFILDKFYIHNNLRQNMHIFNITSRTVITMCEKKWCESGLTELFIKKKSELYYVFCKLETFNSIIVFILI